MRLLKRYKKQKERLVFRFKYLKDNWKLIIHLLFRTYRFGVDNKWWNEFDSIFGLPYRKRWNVIERYKEMRFRAFIGFVPKDVACKLFPTHAKRYIYKSGDDDDNRETFTQGH